MRGSGSPVSSQLAADHVVGEFGEERLGVSSTSACASTPQNVLSARDVLDDRELLGIDRRRSAPKRSLNSVVRAIDLLFVERIPEDEIVDAVAEERQLAADARRARAQRHVEAEAALGAERPGCRSRRRNCRGERRSNRALRAPDCAPRAPGSARSTKLSFAAAGRSSRPDRSRNSLNVRSGRSAVGREAACDRARPPNCTVACGHASSS